MKGIPLHRFLPCLMAVLLFPAALCAQEGSGGGGPDTLRRHFTDNAGRYYIPAYPQFWVGMGAWFASPDVSAFDDRFQPSDRPSGTPISPAVYGAARIQLSPNYSVTVSFATRKNSRGGYNRYALDACFHLPFQQFQPSNLFFGAGAARIEYGHDGNTGMGTHVRIEARSNTLHVLGGLNLIVPGGPGLTVAAGYEFMAEKNGLDLSMPFLHVSVMF